MALSDPPEASQLPSGPNAEQLTPLECPVCNTNSGRVVVLSLSEAEFTEPATVAKLRSAMRNRSDTLNTVAAIALRRVVVNSELMFKYNRLTAGCRSQLTRNIIIEKSFNRLAACCTLRPKSLTIFHRVNEGLDHLGADEVTVELVQFRQPEIVSRVVSVLWVIGIAPQITKELHQHEGAIEFLGIQGCVLRHPPQRTPSGRHITR